jgi:methionyl-tRNA formyltransferase
VRIVFMGRRPHSIDALRWLIDEGHEIAAVVTMSGIDPEVPFWSPCLRDYAVSNALPLMSEAELYQDLAGTDTEKKLADVDLVVSFLYWKRIKPPLIEAPRFGCINFHPAPLPAYRGLGGYNFAILHRRERWGATAHYVDEMLDTGPIIDVREFGFDWRSATALSLERATRPVIVELFKSTIRRVAESGRLPTRPNTGGHYYSRREFEEAKRLDLATMSAEEVDLRARAFWYPPFEGAYIEHDGERFTVAPRSAMGNLSVLHSAYGAA